MCFCCCHSRKSILTSMIVISVIAFIYGIVAISYFASKTDVYKALMEKLESIESSKSTSSNSGDYLRRLPTPQDDYTYKTYYGKAAQKFMDQLSLNEIYKLDTSETYNYSVLKSLKSIEGSLGVVLFIFPIIFLVIEIVFLVFICGNKEFTPVTVTQFKAFSIIKCVCIALSVIFIFLSITYGILLVISLIQYLAIIPHTDSCSIGLYLGLVYGYYLFIYYINLASAFSTERKLFINVGSIESPGTGARFDVNGNPIVVPAQGQVTQPIIYTSMQQTNNQMIQNTQNPVLYQQLNLNSEDEYIIYNGMIYKKVGNATNVKNVNVIDVSKADVSKITKNEAESRRSLKNEKIEVNN